MCNINNDKFKYTYNLINLIAGIIWLIISFNLDNGDGTFIQRAGSIFVYIGVYIEFNIHMFPNNKTIKQDMVNKYIIIKYFAHLYIALGTLLWGYGDLIFGTVK